MKYEFGKRKVMAKESQLSNDPLFINNVNRQSEFFSFTCIILPAMPFTVSKLKSLFRIFVLSRHFCNSVSLAAFVAPHFLLVFYI